MTLLALINPVMCATIFSKIGSGQPRPVLLGLATRAVITVLVILVLAALFGAKILHAFGVSLDAFSVAGGAVLAGIGISMLRSKSATASTSQPNADVSESSLSPLIMFAASPGTITGVITLAVAHSKLAIPVTALVAVGVATAAMWLAIVLSIYLGGKSSGSGFVRNTVTRFMGLIVIAMGVQFAMTGIHSFFSSPVVS